MDFRPPPTLTTETTGDPHSKRAPKKGPTLRWIDVFWDARTTRVNVSTLADTKNLCWGKNFMTLPEAPRNDKMMKVTGSQYRGKKKRHSSYCWWTKSCTTKDDDYPIICGVLTIPGGAGFCPSTVWTKMIDPRLEGSSQDLIQLVKWNMV